MFALLAGYLAAAQLVEPARLDADDTRRSTLLPYRYGNLALAHAAVPIALLAVGGAAATGTLAATGGAIASGLLMSAAAPSLVGAALVSAYRGVLPQRLLARLTVGMDTGNPLGDLTPIYAVAWYARGPLVALALVTPALHAALASPAGLAEAFTAAAPLLAVATAATLTWTARRAASWYHS